MCRAKFNLPAWGGIVGATHWLKLKACPPVLWRAGARPALARLNRFEGTTQVYCLRKDFLELTGKTRSGPGKGADAETVTGGLDLAEGRKIQEIWVELSLEPISFFKNQAGWPSLYTGSP